MSKRKKRKKNPINLKEVAIQLVTGLVTGIILMIIDKIIN